MWYEENDWNWAPPSQQCTSSCSIVDPKVLGKALNSCLPQPPYLPDLKPPNFLFSRLKMNLKGRFQMAEDIMNMTDEPRAIQQTSSEQGLQKWKIQWEHCIAAQGKYFEMDK
jgi:hypothetical protein